MITMNTNAKAPQVSGNTAAQQAVKAKTAQAGTQGTKVNQAAVENRVESQAKSSAKSEVKREQAGKSAAEEMAKQNAITEQPEDGIRLEISRKGLDREQQARAQEKPEDKTQDKDAQQKNALKVDDDADETKKRIEEQQKVREKIKEQVKKEVDDEKQEIRQTERRDEDQKERQTVSDREKDEDKAATQNVTNFAGYTNAQLQQMYQQGEISRNDYQTEIDKREEKLQQTQQTLTNNDREMAKNISREDRAERQMGAIETAFDEESNTNVNAQTRADIVQSLENPQNTQTQQRSMQQEQQARAFAQWQSDFGFLIR